MEEHNILSVFFFYKTSLILKIQLINYSKLVQNMNMKRREGKEGEKLKKDKKKIKGIYSCIFKISLNLFLPISHGKINFNPHFVWNFTFKRKDYFPMKSFFFFFL